MPSRRTHGAARTVWSFLAVLALACIGTAQTAKESQLTIAAPPLPSTGGAGCPVGVNFETAGYTVASVEVTNPFDFLPWIRAAEAKAKQKISALVQGQPFRYDSAVRQALDIINGEDFFPNVSQVKVRVRLEFVVVHCSGKNADLLYRVYSSQVTPALTGTPEGQAAQQRSPQKMAGLVDGASPFHLTPSVGFDATDKVYAGGAMNIDLCASCKYKLQGIAEGQGSQQMMSVHVAIKGSRDGLGPIAHSSWLLNYNNSSLPTGAGQLRNEQASLQYSAATRSFWGGDVSARFGGLLGKGDEEALLHLPLPANVLAASAVNALKVDGGLNSRMPNNVFSASFGLALGTADVTSGVEWKKYIGDLRHQFWHSLGDISSVDIDSRLTVGWLQGAKIPLAERFFGGNYEQLFAPDDSWQIRSNPVIRAIPGSRFYQTSAGAGGDRFLSYNLTAAFSAWRKPVVPRELSKSDKFAGLLEAQLNSATSVTQLHYLTVDPNYKDIVKNSLPEITQALDGLKTAVTASRQAHPDQFSDRFQSCTSAINMAARRTASAVKTTDAAQYGNVATLLEPPATKGGAGGDADEDRVTKVLTRCNDLVTALGANSGIDLTSLTNAKSNIETSFSKIDQTVAEGKAKADMKFVRRTLHTLFHDANLVSVGPVAVLDVAQIGPSGPGVNGTRYGPGGGVRLELASSVNFTLGYARNINRGPGEGSGAVFFSIGMRDIFH